MDRMAQSILAALRVLNPRGEKLGDRARSKPESLDGKRRQEERGGDK
jgi:hypothetical protein